MSALGFLILLDACLPAAKVSGGASGPAADTAKGVVFSCSDPSQRGSSEPDVRRLLLPQVVNTLNDLFGTTATLASAPVQTAIASLPNDEVASLITDVGPEFSTPLMTPLVDLVFTLATSVAASPADMQAIAGSCAATFPLTDACTTSFLSTFGALVLRRPVTSDDVTAYLTTFKADGSTQTAFVTMLSRLLLGPEFLHIVAYGDPTQVAGRYKLTPWEVAARISYRLTNTMPDAELRAAAADGTLADPAVVKTQATRLVQTPAGRAEVQQLFAQFLGVSRMEQPYTFFAGQLGITDTAAFQTELATEVSDYVAYMTLDSESTFADFITSPLAFPRSAQMAKIYGAASQWTGSGTPPTATNGQLGVAMRAAVLTSDRVDTAPLVRGVFIRKRLLCDPLGSPDADAVAAAVAASTETDPTIYSNRQIYTAQTASPTCMSCHARIDPPGFTLEGFDPMGMPRPMELVYDANNNQIATHAIDTKVDDLVFSTTTPEPASTPSDMVHDLATTPEARACLGQQLFRYTRLQTEVSSDDCLLADLEVDVMNGVPMHDVLVHSVANDDVFWKR